MNETSNLTTYCTYSKIIITRKHTEVDTTTSLEKLTDQLDQVAGGIFLSNYEYTNRYTRWNLGFKNPPLVLEGQGENFTIRVLTPRGKLLLTIIWEHLKDHNCFRDLKWHATSLKGRLNERSPITNESERVTQPSLINLVKVIRDIFYSQQDNI